jgi:hypothetical protein
LWINSFWDWWSGLGLPPSFQAALEVRGRKSGRKRSDPVVIATVAEYAKQFGVEAPQVVAERGSKIVN